MPNSELDKNVYVIDKPIVKQYIGSDTVTYTNLTTIKSRLESKDNLNGAENLTLRWIINKLNHETNKVDAPKRARMESGEENVYKKPHERKDNDPTTPGGIPKFTGGGKHSKPSDQLMSNRPADYYKFESIDAQISKMKYLIEYMYNKKEKL